MPLIRSRQNRAQAKIPAKASPRYTPVQVNVRRKFIVKVRFYSQSSTFQILTVPSVPQEARRFPSGLNATPEMLAVRGSDGG